VEEDAPARRFLRGILNVVQKLDIFWCFVLFGTCLVPLMALVVVAVAAVALGGVGRVVGLGPPCGYAVEVEDGGRITDGACCGLVMVEGGGGIFLVGLDIGLGWEGVWAFSPPPFSPPVSFLVSFPVSFILLLCYCVNIVLLFRLLRA